MAVKKKKKAVAKKTARKPARPGKKTARPAKRVSTANASAKKKAKAKKTAKKKAASREFGEGNYKASQRFRTSEEAFVKKNKARIPALGKQAEAALEGPEGDSLRAAEAEADGHAAKKS